MIGRNDELSRQIEALQKILRFNRPLCRVAEESEGLAPADYYLGAGCIAQTVWNYQNGNPPMHGIDDIDFVYYDGDLSGKQIVQPVRRIDP